MPVQLIDFRPHTWETWQAEYRPGIRCHVEWEKLKRPKVCSDLVTARVFYPWREGHGSWMDSEIMKEVILGKSPLLIRLPAVVIPDFNPSRFLLLDGCHRVKSLKPMALILDYLILRKGDERYFADLREVKSGS